MTEQAPDIHVGDLIHAERKDSPELTITGRVREVSAGCLILDADYALYSRFWNISVTERPWELPTEPGYYLLTRQVALPSESRTVVLRTASGVWRNLGPLTEAAWLRQVERDQPLLTLLKLQELGEQA